MALRPVGPATSGVLLPLPSSDRLPAALRAGHTVRARVHTDAAGQLLMTIGRTRLPVAGQLGLHAGEQLTVRLVNTASGAALEILTRRGAPTSPAAIALLRQAIPRQENLGTLLATLRALRVQPQQNWGGLSVEQRQSIDALLARLAPSARLQQADGVRVTLRDSGILLEWLLPRYPQAAGQIAQADFKVALLRVIAQLRSNPAAGPAAATDTGLNSQPGLLNNLLHQAEGALARLHLLQLQPTESPARVDLALQIPLAHGNDTDELYLRIRQEAAERETTSKRESGVEKTGWEVSLRFRFAGNEALAARLHIVGRRATVTWWTEQPRLATALEVARPVLVDQLQALDLEVASIRCHRAPAPHDPTDTTRPRGGLVHETA
ncbi:flagellar hook-length control protein FliK [Nitrococcus mobilis]|uniref:Flagellar hook-length control protein-like C-terminal domain-containing protein n=1 Tax=Nitrococcus mobilis Nb-231 TaxID=314278 RepID=A4BRA7_9GAMM|nr:flagellar hook-length control protein FliK [Nitrococcus mobilis]EAR21729.1 hypothetical protein NB231_03330 [Nitrococcus mobilis Nb-231]